MALIEFIVDPKEDDSAIMTAGQDQANEPPDQDSRPLASARLAPKLSALSQICWHIKSQQRNPSNISVVQILNVDAPAVILTRQIYRTKAVNLAALFPSL